MTGIQWIKNQFNRPYLNRIDLSKRILEIGPLNTPTIKKTDGNNVFYADIRSTAELRIHYGDGYKNICEIDYVIKDSYEESLKNTERFDYIVASHVLEHIPRLIYFFLDIAEVLKPKGKICLAIPDKRFCHDRFRNSTSFAECYDAYKKGQEYYPVRILDFFMNLTLNDPIFLWRNQNNFDRLISSDEALFNVAMDRYEKAAAYEPVDYPVHYHVFTPESFLILLYNMTSFKLFPFHVKEFYYTKTYRSEFCAVLEFDNELLNNNQKILIEKKYIIKLLKRNYDSLVFTNPWKMLNKMINLPYLLYRSFCKSSHG